MTILYSGAQSATLMYTLAWHFFLMGPHPHRRGGKLGARFKWSVQQLHGIRMAESSCKAHDYTRVPCILCYTQRYTGTQRT
jgi:hypothetical protein